MESRRTLSFPSICDTINLAPRDTVLRGAHFIICERMATEQATAHSNQRRGSWLEADDFQLLACARRFENIMIHTVAASTINRSGRTPIARFCQP